MEYFFNFISMSFLHPKRIQMKIFWCGDPHTQESLLGVYRDNLLIKKIQVCYIHLLKRVAYIVLQFLVFVQGVPARGGRK